MVKSLPTTQSSQVMETGVGECNFHLLSLKLLLRLRDPCTLPSSIRRPRHTAASFPWCRLHTLLPGDLPPLFSLPNGMQALQSPLPCCPQKQWLWFFMLQVLYCISHYKSTRCKTLRKLHSFHTITTVVVPGWRAAYSLPAINCFNETSPSLNVM